MSRADSSAPKLLGLEIARVTCALSVLLWHYSHFFQTVGAPRITRAEQPLHWLFAPFYEFGLMGVYVFWSISGFIFFWKYGAAIGAGAVGPGKFFWLRASRLYPLHLAALLLVAGLQPIHVALTGHPFVYDANTLPNFLLQLGMATHWASPAPFSFNGPSWSISAEVCVYAAFFLLMRRFGPTNWLIGAVVLTSLAAMFAGAMSPPLVCAGFFFAGGAAAKLYSASTINGGAPAHRWLAAVALTALFGGLTTSGIATDFQTLPIALMIAAVPGLFLLAQEWGALARHAALLQAAGNCTYSSYMIHFPMQLALAISVAASGVVLPVMSPWFVIAYLVATFAAARWVFVRFERPAQDWIRAAMLRRAPSSSVTRPA